ncbi:MAG: hypothetical protein ACREM2_09790, partial [Vulcanimicrobiaceae bacterium]
MRVQPVGKLGKLRAACGARRSARAPRGRAALTMLRGSGSGLEFVFSEGGFGEAWSEISARLAERPSFYRGSEATAIFEGGRPEASFLEALVSAVGAQGIALRGIRGDAELAELAEAAEVAYLGPAPERPKLARRSPAARTPRAAPQGAAGAELTARARSLDPDFAGARAE